MVSAREAAVGHAGLSIESMVIDEKPCSHLKNAAALNLPSNNWKSIATCCMVVVSYSCGALERERAGE